MWFSTADGLTSFDGTSVTNHSTQQQANDLSLNKIGCFIEDKYNNLYLGTRTNIIYFNRKEKSFTPITYTFSDTKKNDVTGAMCFFIKKINTIKSTHP